MNQKTIKRIRRKNREEFPQTNESDIEYRLEIKQLSKENKILLNTRRLHSQNPKTFKKKRKVPNGFVDIILLKRKIIRNEMVYQTSNTRVVRRMANRK